MNILTAYSEPMDNLKTFKNKHKNQRAFIACSGPSLNDVPVEKLQGEIVFALNRGYLKSGLPITYLVTADKRVESAFADEIKELDCIKFCNRIEGEGIVNYKFQGGEFSTDASEGVRLGHSVTVVALQLAYYMGCDPVIIVGMDHYLSYDEAEAHDGREYSNIDKDVNHFSEDYYPPDYKYRYQNLDAVEYSYKQAREAFEADGRTLLNASSVTHLPEEIIPRADFEAII